MDILMTIFIGNGFFTASAFSVLLENERSIS